MIRQLSVIIPVIERGNDIVELHQRYYAPLDSTDSLEALEFIYIVTPMFAHLIPELEKNQVRGHPLTIIELNRDFGEASAIKVGVNKAKYDAILTLPAYIQVPPEEIPSILGELDHNDVVVVRRWPRNETGFKLLQSQLLSKILASLSTGPFGDIGCGIRLCKKQVFSAIALYGDFHRFLPMLAFEQGFSVKIVDLPQSHEDTQKSLHSPRTYLGRLLDIITVIFLTKFNKRPLRFFGALGSIALAIGTIGLLYIGAERIFMDIGAADRPIMVLFLLFAVLGVQLLAIGLVGETIIFTHAGDMKEYNVKEIHKNH